MLGKQGTFGRLTRRPSEVFREHFLVAPYPEESVTRVTEAVGIAPVVFGSDFPHGEGMAFPAEYAATQLASFSDDEVKSIMHDNLAAFLGA
jgi:predicted TIM-barrel fold metal-dependent hydrolase